MGLWRKVICFLRLHGMRSKSDGVGMWGECEHCGAQAGYVTRAEVRRYIDRCENSGVCPVCERPEHAGPCAI